MSSSNKSSRNKRKFPKSFLDCPSLSLVVNFPSSDPPNVVTTPVASEAVTEIFLERFAKEIVKPFRTVPEKGGESFVMADGQLKKVSQSTVKIKKVRKSDIWSRRLAMGTNRCLRILDKCMHEGAQSPRPLLILLARDIYPPTMLVHVPVVAKRLAIPLLLLPGKASNDLGRAIGVRKTSIVIFLPPSSSQSPDDLKICSFVEFVRCSILTQNELTVDA